MSPSVRALTICAGLALAPAVALGLGRFAYALVLPAMRQDLAWSYAEAGALNSANAAGHLAGALAASAAPPFSLSGATPRWVLWRSLVGRAVSGSPTSSEYCASVGGRWAKPPGDGDGVRASSAAASGPSDGGGEVLKASVPWDSGEVNHTCCSDTPQASSNTLR